VPTLRHQSDYDVISNYVLGVRYRKAKLTLMVTTKTEKVANRPDHPPSSFATAIVASLWPRRSPRKCRPIGTAPIRRHHARRHQILSPISHKT
jgi:hypothetical protein